MSLNEGKSIPVPIDVIPEEVEEEDSKSTEEMQIEKKDNVEQKDNEPDEVDINALNQAVFNLSLSDDAEERSKQKKLLSFYASFLNFVKHLDDAIDSLCSLLGSNNNTDVLESLRFLSKAYAFQLDNVTKGLKKMTLLIWKEDQSIKDEVIQSLNDLYINVPGR
jgi:condensin complex subunit 1